ncbi:sugar ABC transporter ATP-binding protein, partial [Rhizobium ruizarguesonis]
MSQVVLSAKGVVKRFGGVKALRGVDFDLQVGEIHALLGENGAG